MPEYLAPGVFVEETSFRSKSIEGVGTSVAGIVGPTRTGPTSGVPVVVTSYGEYTRVFGDDDDLVFGGAPVANFTALAARAFFDNGGKQLYVARIEKNATTASRADGSNVLAFTSRFPGAAGNVALEFRPRDSENLLRVLAARNPAAGDAVFVDARGVALDAFREQPVESTHDRFPLRSFKAAGTVVDVGGTLVVEFEWRDAAIVDAAGDDFANALDQLRLDAIPAAAISESPALGDPVGIGLAEGSTMVVTLADDASLEDVQFGGARRIVGTLTADKASIAFRDEHNPGLSADVEIPVARLAAQATTIAHRAFDIDVLPLSADGATLGDEPVYIYGNVSTAGRDAPSSLHQRTRPTTSEERHAMPVTCDVDTDAGDVHAALHALFDPGLLAPSPSTPDEPRYVVKLASGTDGDAPLSIDYAGVEDDKGENSTGFAALELVEDVSIVMTPAACALALTEHQGVVLEMQKHCRRMKYRVGLVDGRSGMGVADVRDWRGRFSDSRLALYHPWIRIPSGRPEGGELLVPPAGSIAGVYARTDVTRGVHKAPANEVVFGALGFEQDVNTFQQELLNPIGVNCLRSFPNRGHRVWGGRTLTDDPEWKYVNVRRYFLYLERSIDRSTQWVVFEPNGERLWENIRATVDGFLFNEWRNGRLLGSTPKEAYFVRCDRSTMTQNDLDNGRLVCLVGVAPLRPAEFVIFRIGQKTADA